MSENAEAARGYRRGVGIILLNAEGKVFVGQRFDSTAEAWQMPQGGIDKGEEPEKAAFRELEEETGVNAGHISLIAESADWLFYDLPTELQSKIWKGKYRGQAQKWYAMRLEASDAVVNIATEEPEFSSWRWASPEELPDLAVEFKRELYLELLMEFQPYFSHKT